MKIQFEGTGEIFYATKLSAGFDICAQIDTTLDAGKWKCIPTGLKIIDADASFPKTFVPELQIRPRSGLALRYGITVLNSPSTIDADYRGEIQVILINHSIYDFDIKKGDRIAQGVIAKAYRARGVKIKDVERGNFGLGHTGVRND